ncbi:ABC transporter substrate-binding protein [Natronosalvus halobius]|uniref:ABC transporter substrate-binding protein n=1 Tax=Natronosalvus halobius TaxID=2953746 RepID=UPI0020A20E80|nr:ABC transporter substrate-binding protein [Natronosalvus halobius]USZ73646.1 ABC transporter substrate-binding protein [Natronosalvus halobius]
MVDSETKPSKRRFGRRRMLNTLGGSSVAMLAGCIGGGDGGDDDTITIGSLQPLSGNFAPWGSAHSAGLEFAIDAVNENGGVLDREVEIVEADTESNPGEGDSIFRRFAEQEGAVAMTGPVSSDLGIRTAQTAEEMEIPIVFHMAGTHEALKKSSRYTFRVGSLTAMMDIQNQVELIEERGFENVGAIMGDYAWGQSVDEQFEERIPDSLNFHKTFAPLGESSFETFIRDMPEDLEMMIASGHPPGQISIHNQLLDLGYDPEITTGAGYPPSVIHGGLGSGKAETFGHIHIVDVYGDEFQDVATQFAEQRDERMDTHVGLGYVAGELITTAIEQADSTDPVDIATEIRNIELETILAAPLKYTEWGEIDDVVTMFSTFESEAPDYYPDGEYKLNEYHRSEPLSADIVEPYIEEDW